MTTTTIFVVFYAVVAVATMMRWLSVPRTPAHRLISVGLAIVWPIVVLMTAGLIALDTWLPEGDK